MLIIGIDASNIRSGGGVTHLKELLNNFAPLANGIQKIIVWGGHATLKVLPPKEGIVYQHHKMLDKNILIRLVWQLCVLNKMAAAERCNVLFIPGGLYLGKFRPFITMSQNLLPFDSHEKGRYGFSLSRFRLTLLKYLQLRTFKNSVGVIFLTKYAYNKVLGTDESAKFMHQIIPHGINREFYINPKHQKEFKDFSINQPFKLLYISIIDLYKHQWLVVEAVANLRKIGYPIKLTLIGPSFKKALTKLNDAIKKFDPRNEFVEYLGFVSHQSLPEHYLKSDGFIFASTCESMPIILIEAMAAGLPLACSKSGPMPEVLKDAGFYFDPEDKQSIINALKDMLNSPKEREVKAQKAFEYAKNYSWEKCAQDTFKFIQDANNNYKSEPKH
jgi:glycosyltransferase involved in cell wall biosynthesis